MRLIICYIQKMSQVGAKYTISVSFVEVAHEPSITICLQFALNTRDGLRKKNHFIFLFKCNFCSTDVLVVLAQPKNQCLIQFGLVLVVSIRKEEINFNTVPSTVTHYNVFALVTNTQVSNKITVKFLQFSHSITFQKYLD